MSYLFWRIYVQPLSAVRWEMILLLLAWAVLGRWAKGARPWVLLNRAVFWVTLGAILFTTVFSRSASNQTASFLPFYTFVEAKKQPELYRTMLMNIFLFQPIGMSLPCLLRGDRHPVARTILFALVLSVGIECAQLGFHLGRCETDDVIMNTLGAAIGTLAQCLSRFPGTQEQNPCQRKKTQNNA